MNQRKKVTKLFSRAVLVIFTVLMISGVLSSCAFQAGTEKANAAVLESGALQDTGAISKAEAGLYEANYSIDNQWGVGFVVKVTIVNNSAAAMENWRVEWTFDDAGQKITGGWNAKFSQSGTKVTVTNEVYNGKIPAGGQVSFGFQGSYSGSNNIPSDITVNGSGTSSSTSSVSSSSSSSSAGNPGGKFIGQITAGSVPSNFNSYWNQVTPENGGKWGSAEPGRDSYNWSDQDTSYNHAKGSGLPFKAHTLVWGSQEPNWIKNGSLSDSEKRAEVEEWIADFAARYPGCDFIDVVNEPLHAKPSYRNAIGGDGSTGWDWVIWSFEQARQHFPNTKLLINEYGIITDPNAARQYITIINLLKSRNLIDGIGIQCHQFNVDNGSTSTMQQVLDMLAATGLPVYVSELDITGDDATQLNRYKSVFPVLYDHPAVKGITLWGWIQGQTWKDNTHLVTSGGQERPALTWLRENYLSGGSSSSTSSASSSNSSSGSGTKNAFSTIEAEEYDSTTSSTVEIVGTDNGGSGIGYLENGDTFTFSNVDFGSGASSFSARVASEASSTIQVRLNSASGTILGTLSDTSTGGWNDYQELSANISTVTGLNDLVLVVSGAVNIDSFTFDTGSASSSSSSSSSTGNGTFHVFLLLGQSNMAGYPTAQASDKVADERILVLDYDTNQWRTATPPLHESWQNAIGPGDWFSKTIIDSIPAGDTIGLVPCAISGEKIETFMKNGGSKYAWIIERAKMARQRGGIIEGILFNQGESNNGDPNWPGNVNTLVTDLRTDLTLGNVPFLAGELLYSGGCAGHNTLINQLPGIISNCYVVSAQGLVVDPSDSQWNLHFGHDSQVEFGKRYAAGMIEALGW